MKKTDYIFNTLPVYNTENNNFTLINEQLNNKLYIGRNV